MKKIKKKVESGNKKRVCPFVISLFLGKKTFSSKKHGLLLEKSNNLITYTVLCF
jgi:hypothetical protein